MPPPPTSPLSPEPVLQIRLLGGCDFELNGAALRLETAKTSALLAYLALQRSPQSRDKLTGLFWGDLPENKAKANLRHALWHLRSRLEVPGAPPFIRADPKMAVFERQGPYRLDVEEFEETLQNETSLPAQGSPARQPKALLQAALALYRGDFLDGLYFEDAPAVEEWIIIERERLRALAMQALQRLVAYALSWGEYEEGIAHARRLLAMEPWQEETHRQLMRLLLLNNQRGAALLQYETCCRILAEELALEPAPETRALVESIRLSTEGARPPRPSAPEAHLPPQTSPFIGREEELARIGELLQRPACRLISCIGPGGMGKTRLAIRAAAAANQFSDGVYFVPLASIDRVDLLAPALADALGFTFYGSEEPTVQLLNHLKNKNLLLLLDNFEHLLAGADFLGEILRAAPGVKMLVTTRERLNLGEEWLFELEGLQVPPARPADGTAHGPGLEDYSAVKLFVQCARRVRLDFALSEENQAALGQLCSLVGGMPLALELAAGWARTLSCAEIAAEVSRDLDLLVTSQRDLPERHRSIRAVFENSWKRLGEPEREALKRLAVFRDGFQLEAAREVCGASIPLLSLLVDRSMLSGSTSGRYKMHELLRQYIEEKLTPAEQSQNRDRHSRYYAGFLEQHRKDLSISRLKQALEAISAEIENVRAGWNWATATRQIEWVMQSQYPLYRFYELRNRFTEGEAALRQASEMFASLPQNAEQISSYNSTLLWRARFFTRLARSEQAEELLQKCLELLKQNFPQREHSTALVSAEMGMIALMNGRYTAAQERFEEALAINRQINDPNVISNMCNLGYVACQLGDYSEAALLLNEMVARCRAGGFHEPAAFGNYYLGLVALGEGAVERATRRFEEALQTYTDLQHAWGTALCRQGQALVALEQDRPAEAARLAGEGLAHARSIKDAHSTALCLNCLGRAASALGKAEEAQAYYLEALQTAWQARQPPPALDSLIGIAAGRAGAGQFGPARSLLELAAGHPACVARERRRARLLLSQLAADGDGGNRPLTLEEAVSDLLGQ